MKITKSGRLDRRTKAYKEQKAQTDGCIASLITGPFKLLGIIIGLPFIVAFYILKLPFVLLKKIFG